MAMGGPFGFVWSSVIRPCFVGAGVVASLGIDGAGFSGGGCVVVVVAAVAR